MLVLLQVICECNVGFDLVWFEVLVLLFNQNNCLLVCICNYSDEDFDNVCLSVCYNGQEKFEGVLSVFVCIIIVDLVNINVNQFGWQDVILSIIDYFIQFDD